MPSVPDDSALMRGVTGQAPAPPEPLTDPWGAAFRQANSVVSLATSDVAGRLSGRGRPLVAR